MSGERGRGREEGRGEGGKRTNEKVTVGVSLTWSKGLSVCRWKSSGKTCMMHSSRYSCAMASLHLTTCSNILGRTD